MSDESEISKLRHEVLLSHLLEIKQMLRDREARPRVATSGRAPEDVVAEFKCPTCYGPMKLLTSKSGKNYAGCAGYPDCRGIRWMNGDVPQDRNGKSCANPQRGTQPSEFPKDEGCPF